MSQNEKIEKQNEHKSLLANILEKKISYFSLPSELQTEPELKSELYKEKFLLIEKAGYDILTEKFFVMEICQDKDFNHHSYEEINYNGLIYYRLPIRYFEDIEEYFNFVLGNIYENTCFYQYEFSDDFLKNHKIDYKKINFDSLIDDTLDCYIHRLIYEEKIFQKKSSSASRSEIERREKAKQQWLDACTVNLIEAKTYDDFKEEAKKQRFFGGYDEEQIVSHLLKKGSEQTISFVLNYIFDIEKGLVRWIESICAVLGKNIVLDFIQSSMKNINLDSLTKEYQTNFVKEIGYYSDIEEYSSLLTEIINNMYGNDVSQSYLDRQDNILNDFNSSRKSYCDIDVGKKNAFVRICKDIYTNNENQTRFSVSLVFYKNGEYLSRYDVSFDLFFDFIHFVEGDMSNMDLSDCEWLENIKGNSLFDFSDSIVESKIVNRLGKTKVESTFSIDKTKIKHLEPSANNELSVVEQRDLESVNDALPDEMKVYYISDLHLEFRLANFGATTKEDIYIYLKRLCKHLANSISELYADHDNILIVNGDVSADFHLYELFVSLLSNECIKRGNYNNYIIFTLGNHELWPFCGEDLSNIYVAYADLLHEHGCSLLNDSLIYFDLNFHKHEIKEYDLALMDDRQLSGILSRSKLVIFGGTGFAGKNRSFNADDGIYLETISREQEKKLSKKFDDLYKKICRCAGSCKTIIVSHMPKADWSSNEDRQSNFIYLSGHTHKNKFYLCDDYQIYADNQVGYYGYKSSYPEFKYFYVDPSCDIYKSYDDGIYEITKSQYNDFLRSKNIGNICYRSFYKLYMVKKGRYYAFISQSDKGSFCILNGGAMSKLPTKSIKYIYDNMDKVVNLIDQSIMDLYAREKEISNAIQSIGGDGKIHGCIIDIDFYNHIYLNPYDGTITPYYALNMMSRDVYMSIGDLLQNKRPDLYSNYLLKKTASPYKNEIIEIKRKTKSTKLVVKDYGTYIYQSSRVIKKMQKIEKNYLTSWPSSFSDQKKTILGQSSYIGKIEKKNN